MRLAKYAQIDSTQVPLNGSPSDMAYALVSSTGGTYGSLVDAVLRDFPKNGTFLALRTELDDASPKEKAERAFIALRAQARALRRPAHLSRASLATVDEALQSLYDIVDSTAEGVLNGSPEHWDGLLGETAQEARARLDECLTALQLYSELVRVAQAPQRKRVPGAEDVRRPLSSVAADAVTLIDAKRQFADAIQALI